MESSILVVGGAGYVGSHTAQALVDAGRKVVVLDNLSTGFRELVPIGVPIEVGDYGDPGFVRGVIRRHAASAVMHFGALSIAPESIKEPRRYWKSNVLGTLNLLEATLECGIRRFVFSSSCAVYGEPATPTIAEDTPLNPTTPYGRTKRAVEEILADLSVAENLRYVSLRYFNAAGADPEGRRGESHEPETHLIPIILRAALSGRAVPVFGTDYPTEDGTAVRDYVHVVDIAEAHCLALRALEGDGPSRVYNLGSGEGNSVLQVISTAERVVGRRIPWEPKPRRPGDPARLAASASKARRDLGWTPRFGFRDLLEHSWSWERSRQAEN